MVASPHLALTDWPFSVVARPEHCTFIAGRPRLRQDISGLLSNLSRREASSIHVFWSWFGAGKTHSLYYLANEANRLPKDKSQVCLLPVYTEYPKDSGGFLGLYRALMKVISVDRLAEAFVDTWSDEEFRRMTAASTDMANAFRVLTMDRDGRRLALAESWLRGVDLPSSELRAVGIARRLNSTEEAVTVLTQMFRMLRNGTIRREQRELRVVWLLDEFQRLGKAGKNAVDDVNAGLHSLFNACPTGFTQVISFSGKPDPKSLPAWLGRELRDRIGMTKVMVLPPLTREEAMVFVREVLAHYRAETSKKVLPYFPFTEESSEVVIDYIAHKHELRPRVIMQAFTAVLEVADPKIEARELVEVGPDFARTVLSEYVFTQEDEDEE